jgi:preprotein translocase subunit SecF
MNYKLSLAVPIIILVLSLSYLLWQLTSIGLNLDIDLKGGTQIIAESESILDEKKIEDILSEFDANVRTASGLTGYSVFIEFDASIDSNDILKTLSDNGYEFGEYSVQTVGPSLGAASLQQALIVLVMAFVFMALTILFIFKTPLVSLYISLAPAFDIIETLAISQLLGIKLSLASFAALLMIIGYSVDDDVMITTRILKGEGEMNEKIRGSYKTSFTTTAATLVALVALYTMSLSTVITQIASVLLIGLLVDLQNTWLFSTPLLRWYLERKKK